MKCIYCLEDKPQTSFTKTEHVLPQSFGRFENNFTLNGIVCDDCNQHFGNSLEMDLGRDTFEGISRYEYEVRDPKDFKSLGKRSRLQISVAEGPFKGALAYLEYSQERDIIISKPLPQVGFSHNGSQNYKYFELNKIPDKAELDAQGLDYANKVRVFGDSFEKAGKALAEREIFPKFERETPFLEDGSGKWEFEFEGNIDKIICRAIAKIAFNYLAYWQGSEFVLQSEFDPIRQYIRTGEQKEDSFIQISNKNILVDEPSQGSKRLIHVVITNWEKNGVSIISRVSLFNFLSYTILLTKEYARPIPNLRKGHWFNLRNHKIYQLEAR